MVGSPSTSVDAAVMVAAYATVGFCPRAGPGVDGTCREAIEGINIVGPYSSHHLIRCKV